MKTITKSLIALALVFTISGAAYAATYQYVDTQGTLKTVVAVNESEALMKIPDLGPNSGVILMSNDTKIEGSIVVGSVVIATSTTQAEGNVETTVIAPAVMTQYAVTPGQAQAAASAFYKGTGIFSSANITSMFGLAVYSVKFSETGSNMVEIIVNANTGDVLVFR